MAPRGTLEKRVAEAEAEMRCVEAQAKAYAAERNALHQLVDSVRAWAKTDQCGAPKR